MCSLAGASKEAGAHQWIVPAPLYVAGPSVMTPVACCAVQVYPRIDCLCTSAVLMEG